jgi:hypothetical protein
LAALIGSLVRLPEYIRRVTIRTLTVCRLRLQLAGLISQQAGRYLWNVVSTHAKAPLKERLRDGGNPMAVVTDRSLGSLLHSFAVTVHLVS